MFRQEPGTQRYLYHLGCLFSHFSGPDVGRAVCCHDIWRWHGHLPHRDGLGRSPAKVDHSTSPGGVWRGRCWRQGWGDIYRDQHGQLVPVVGAARQQHGRPCVPDHRRSVQQPGAGRKHLVHLCRDLLARRCRPVQWSRDRDIVRRKHVSGRNLHRYRSRLRHADRQTGRQRQRNRGRIRPDLPGRDMHGPVPAH